MSQPTEVTVRIPRRAHNLAGRFRTLNEAPDDHPHPVGTLYTEIQEFLDNVAGAQDLTSNADALLLERNNLRQQLRDLQATTTSTNHTTLSQELQESREETNDALRTIATMREERDAARQSEAAMQQRLATAQQERDEYRAISVQLTRNPHVTEEPMEREKIPDPEKFSGRRDKLPAFLLQLRLKAASFRTEQAKLRFAINCLEGDALDLMRSYVQEDATINLTNLAALTTILDNAYGNPNRAADAARNLRSLRQGTRDFATYYAEYQRYAQEVTWNEEAKLDALRTGLCFRLKKDLSLRDDDPTTVAQLVTICNRLDTRWRTLQAEEGHNPPPRQQQQNAPRRQPIPPPTPTSTIAPATTTTTTTAIGTQPGPMDLTVAGGVRRISSEERQRRMREGLCFYCGGAGHIAGMCPNGRRRPRPLNASEITTTTTTTTAPQDHQEPTVEQGFQ